ITVSPSVSRPLSTSTLFPYTTLFRSGPEGLLRQGPGRTSGTRDPRSPHHRTGGLRSHSRADQPHVHEGPERGSRAGGHAYPSCAERSRGTSLFESDAAGALPPHDGTRARHSFTLARVSGGRFKARGPSQV